MKKLQAAMKESSTRRQAYSLSKIAYKVGSYFKGCNNCGEVEWVQVGDRKVKRYLSGHAVYRAYSPKSQGWSYWCYECGAKDQRAWEDAHDIGKDAVRGTRGAIREQKYRLRKEAMRLEKQDPHELVVPSRTEEIARLEAELARLQALLVK